MPEKFNVLIDTPPSTVSVGGKEYEIQTDFRIALAYIRLIGRKDLSDLDRALFGLQLFFGDEIREDDVSELIAFISFYLRKGREEDKENNHREKRVFDILEDSGRIYAAFFQVYGLNLRKAKIHWWIFSELLDGLPKGTKLSEVIEIRGKKPEKWMKAAEKNDLARLQKLYRLEDEDADPIHGLFDSLMGMLA